MYTSYPNYQTYQSYPNYQTYQSYPGYQQQYGKDGERFFPFLAPLLLGGIAGAALARPYGFGGVPCCPPYYPPYAPFYGPRPYIW